jgi:hypothetical protein
LNWKIILQDISYKFYKVSLYNATQSKLTKEFWLYTGVKVTCLNLSFLNLFTCLNFSFLNLFQKSRIHLKREHRRRSLWRKKETSSIFVPAVALMFGENFKRRVDILKSLLHQVFTNDIFNMRIVIISGQSRSNFHSNNLFKGVYW